MVLFLLLLVGLFKILAVRLIEHDALFLYQLFGLNPLLI